MNTYSIKRVKEAMTSLSGKGFAPIHGDFAIIGDYPWGGGYFQTPAPTCSGTTRACG